MVEKYWDSPSAFFKSFYYNVKFSGALRAPKSTSKYPKFSHCFSHFWTILFFFDPSDLNFFPKYFLFFEKICASFGLRPKTITESCRYIGSVFLLASIACAGRAKECNGAPGGI